MKRDNMVRLTRFKVLEKRRQVEQLDLMLEDFSRMAAELDAQILNEEKKSGITDMNHFAYSTFAKAARLRRDNLQNSAKDLKVQINAARLSLEEAEAELENAEKMEQRDGLRDDHEPRRTAIG
ncbi:flagellar export protein FliJ [Aurantimonas sp. 22II-16-19i]|uniref:flagellar export protein FliJ n=1 Tax=Aurantimonas sp. 22II-16-19i TaxID=1317114 RepID=UPI0009F7CBD5|nr:flagellar export protein FliJ [Aurantimonas sp. 22II-16-19i]MAU95864.1 flagellar export protein FliJ [Fulvimarina sp.]ORE97780.1 hypothetical protein ATO4_07570 [Aurantimonas sp. 22II-16-19i]